MATFPSIAPIYPTTKQSSPFSSKLVFGDGYERSLRFGLNSVRPEWQLEWLVDGTSADTIDSFLQIEAEDGFDWQPPDSSVAIRWRCDEWTVELQNPDVYSVRATFRRVFEPAIVQLTAQASNTCYQDELCNQDLGTISSTVGGQTVKLTGVLPVCTGVYTYVKITYIKSDGSTISEYYNLTTGNVTVNGATYSYSLDGTTIQTSGEANTWEINRWIDYLRTGYKIATDTQCSANANPTALTWPTHPYGDPSLYGPITSDWTPTNGGYPLVYNGTCQYKQTCLKWEAAGYGQTSFIQVCRGATLTQFGPAFWGGFGSIGDPSQTYKYPQFYYSFCDGYSWQVVNNGGAIYLPYAGARLPEFHLTVYNP